MLPGEKVEDLIATLTKLIDDPSITIERRIEGQTRPEAPPSGIDNEMFAALERAQKKVYPGSITVPMMLTGATDGAQMRAKGTQTYGLGVPITMEELGRIHGNDERVNIDNLGKFVEFLHAAVMEIAAAK